MSMSSLLAVFSGAGRFVRLKGAVWLIVMHVRGAFFLLGLSVQVAGRSWRVEIPPGKQRGGGPSVGGAHRWSPPLPRDYQTIVYENFVLRNSFSGENCGEDIDILSSVRRLLAESPPDPRIADLAFNCCRQSLIAPKGLR
ncbi:hypothetical protein SAY86_006368 [Trapa natans]|uniref:Uncharacterized protein n=1 Tax=Trapa natans TaxID=22666 RepID=A0AAN7LBW8_TRANT|nr:hypothetical protein SAY86_006368 [Trapa natans]